MSEVDPDPNLPVEEQGRSEYGGRPEPSAGDPTEGGKHGQIGAVPSITSDEPDDDGPGYPVGGGRVTEDRNAPPVADPGPEA